MYVLRKIPFVNNLINFLKGLLGDCQYLQYLSDIDLMTVEVDPMLEQGNSACVTGSCKRVWTLFKKLKYKLHFIYIQICTSWIFKMVEKIHRTKIEAVITVVLNLLDSITHFKDILKNQITPYIPYF